MVHRGCQDGRGGRIAKMCNPKKKKAEKGSSPANAGDTGFDP